MAINLKCPGCNRSIIISSANTGWYRCECGIINTKRTMVDMEKLRQKKIDIQMPDAWDKTLAKEPTGMSYQEGNQEVTI